MGKLLSATDRILIGLAVFGDLLEQIGEDLPSKKKWHMNAYRIMGENYKKNNYTSTLSRMLNSDSIERVVKNGTAIIRITSLGEKKVNRDFPFLRFQKQKWDGKWRIVTFDITEKKRALRERLRYKLKELGFGMLQKSTWISPHNFEDEVREFFSKNGLSNDAYIFVADKLLAGDMKTLVEKLWNIQKINNLYKKASKEKNNRVLCEALSKDPFLPKKLLPSDWFGNSEKNLLYLINGNNR